MLDQRRLEAEIELFRRKNFLSGAWKFVNLNGTRPFLAAVVKTKVGNIYTIQIELERFPQNVPKVFVAQMLRRCDGEAMDSSSRSMHTLDSEHGWTRICHYGVDSWTPGVSLYKIYIKCALWLNCYEAHLRTGKPMDYYLSHQA